MAAKWNRMSSTRSSPKGPGSLRRRCATSERTEERWPRQGGPGKDEFGQVERWLIARTLAPHADTTVPGSPETVSRDHEGGFGLTTPETVQKPSHPPTVTGDKRNPVTVTVDTGLLDCEGRGLDEEIPLGDEPDFGGENP